MRSLLILIPSYKRPVVLEKTLGGLYLNTIQGSEYNIRIAVGLNQSTSYEEEIVHRYLYLFRRIGISLFVEKYKDNIGKAASLNQLLKLYSNKCDYVITMDNDMVIIRPWLHIVRQCNKIEYDIMGFCGTQFWAHDPERSICSCIIKDGLKFYTPFSIAGGMMLFHRSFLEKHSWTNYGGVYGRDDAAMCLLTKKKYVLDIEEDWIWHDPLKNSTPELKEYEDKKVDLYNKGTTVFQVGWDE
jgi:glycosyltransferase involved in cell wall biosynthesis